MPHYIQFCVGRGDEHILILVHYQLHIRLTEHGRTTEYIFNFYNFGRLKFRAERFTKVLPNAKLWPLYATKRLQSNI